VIEDNLNNFEFLIYFPSIFVKKRKKTIILCNY